MCLGTSMHLTEGKTELHIARVKQSRDKMQVKFQNFKVVDY